MTRGALVLALAFALSGCSDPSCEEVVKRLTDRLGPTGSDKVKQCKEEPWSGALRNCMMTVTSEQEFTSCLVRHRGLKYMTKGPDAPGRTALQHIERALKDYWVEHAALPSTPSPLVPDSSCCDQRGPSMGKCQPDPSLWAKPPWSDLDFSIDDATPFRFAYDVIGPQEVAVRAVADADCDASEYTLTLRLQIVGGSPTSEITASDKPD